MSKNLFDLITINNYNNKYCISESSEEPEPIPPNDIILISLNKLYENVDIGYVVGILSTIDDNLNINQRQSIFIYTLNNYNDKFTIFGDLLKVNGNLDYELKQTYILNITSINEHGLSFSKDIIIEVNNINEPSKITTITKNSLIENNKIGDVIGKFKTIDPDYNSVFEYSLVGINKEKFIIEDDILKAGEIFNYNDKNKYTINVKTYDGLTNIFNDIEIFIESSTEEPEPELEMQNIELFDGWNWISFYLNNESMNFNNDLVLTDSILEGNKLNNNLPRVLIKNQKYFSSYYDNFNKWFGSLNEFNIYDCFMVYLNKNNIDAYNNFLVEGIILDNIEIKLFKGWNWIGFPENNEKLLLEVINNANEGDFIKSQIEFSEYFNEIGWIGNLEKLSPNRGYLYYSQKEFKIIFNKNSNLKRNRFIKKNINNRLTIDGNNIELSPLEFEYTSCLTAQIYSNGILVIGGILICYKNNLVRGISNSNENEWTYISELNTTVSNLKIYLNEDENENDILNFKYSDGLKFYNLSLNQNINLIKDSIIGSSENPIIMNLTLEDQKPIILEVNSSWNNLLNNYEDPQSINIKFQNVVNNQTAIVYITHDNLTNNNDTIDNIVDYIFKGEVNNNELTINIESNGLIGLENHILYTIVVDVENPNCLKADTHDTTQFIISITEETKITNHTFKIGSIPITQNLIDFYKLLLDGIDMLVYSRKECESVDSGFFNLKERKFIKKDIKYRYDILEYMKIYNEKNLMKMNINLLHNIQIQIYGNIFEYKEYIKLYPDEEDFDEEDFSIEKLRDIEKDLYKNYNDRNKYYQDTGFFYGENPNKTLEEEKETLSNIHLEMYDNKLEYLIYWQNYGFVDEENIDEDLLNEIKEEIFDTF